MVELSRLRLFARRLANTALDLIYPPQCLSCHRAGSLLCSDCQAKIPVPPPLIEADSPIAERRATAEFDGVIQQAIHALKYKSQYRYTEPLGQRLATELSHAGWQPDLIAATPLHTTRLRSRGYNQSALLAELLSAKANIPFCPELLHRTRDTRAQVGLNTHERQANVRGAFEADSKLATGKRIVIVDDVYTTGATLRECADTLRNAGAVKVWALTVACTLQHNARS